MILKRQNAKKSRKRVSGKLSKLLCMIALLLLNLQFAVTKTYAGIGDTKIFTGTKKLFNDMKEPLIGLSAIVAVVLIIYNLIRMKMAEDDQDAKIYKRKIKTIVMCAIGVVLVGSLLTAILSYYK